MKLTTRRKFLTIALCGLFSVLLFSNFKGTNETENTINKHEYQKNREIEGVILDQKGNPISGVTLAAEGGTKTKSGKDGKFRIQVSSKSTISVGKDGFKVLTFQAMPNEKDPKMNPFFKIILANTDKDKNNQGYILFCCTNHEVSHCSEDLEELEQLAQSKGCEF